MQASFQTPAITPEHIRAGLRQPLPGLPAQLRMAPPHRPNALPASGVKPRDAGVLLLLYPLYDELHFVLTRRAEQPAEYA